MQMHATLRHYARIIRQRFILILFGVTFCAATTGIISICTPPIYQARALLKVNTIATNGNNDIYNTQALAVDYALLVTSPEVLQAVAQKLPGVTREDLQQAISDAPIENTQIIEVRAQAREAQLAAKMANMVTATFIQIQVSKEADRLQSSANLLTQHIAETRLDLDAAQAYLDVLQNQHAAPASVAQQKSLVDTDQANYGLLLSDYSQLQVQKLQANSALSIAQTAQPPDKPSNPLVLFNMLLAAAMSLLFMVLLVLLLDWLDTSIKTNEDVINLARMMPLGCVPASSRVESGELLNPAVQSCIPVREALNMVGINLRSHLNGPGLLLVSGTRTRAGATTIATYLALSLAQAGLRVLLLDANLHRPMLHEVFHAPNVNGLSNRLADVERFQEQSALHPYNWLQHWKTPFVNLWLLPSGPLPVQMSTAGIQELQQLKAWLLGTRQKPTYGNVRPLVDLILCDTAPLGEGSDTYALSTIADGVVMVIEAGKEQKETLCETHAAQLRAPIIGVVVNRQKTRQMPYYYIHTHNTLSSREVHKVYSAGEESIVQEPELSTEFGAREELMASAPPEVPLAAPLTTSPRKIAESLTPSPPLSRSSVRQSSGTRKLALVSRLVPKTPASSLSNDLLMPAPQQAGGAQMLNTDSPAPVLLEQERAGVNTDPLPEKMQVAGAELQGSRKLRAAKPQFRTHPGKRN